MWQFMLSSSCHVEFYVLTCIVVSLLRCDVLWLFFPNLSETAEPSMTWVWANEVLYIKEWGYRVWRISERAEGWGMGTERWRGGGNQGGEEVRWDSKIGREDMVNIYLKRPPWLERFQIHLAVILIFRPWDRDGHKMGAYRVLINRVGEERQQTVNENLY